MEVAPWLLAAIPGIRFGIFLCVSRIVRIVLQAGHWYIVPRVLWAGQAAPNYRSRTLTEPTPLPSPPPSSPSSSSSTFSSFALPPFAECTSPLPSPFQTPSPPLLSSLYTELSPGLGWIGWLPVFSDPWLRYPFTIPFRPSLSLSLFSLLSLCWMATGQFIHRFFLFLFFALFRFSLSRAWKSTHTLRVPPSPSLRRGTLFRGVRVRIPRFCLSNVVPVKVTSDRGTRSLWEADDERSWEEVVASPFAREEESLRNFSRCRGLEDRLRRDWPALIFL